MPPAEWLRFLQQRGDAELRFFVFSTAGLEDRLGLSYRVPGGFYKWSLEKPELPTW